MLRSIEGIESRLREHAADVDREMTAVLDEQVDDEWMRGAIRYHFGWADADFRPLPEAEIRSGGKKLRPGLALLSYQGAQLTRAGGAGQDVPFEDALPFAAALEMLHNYSLVHDDVQDADRMRRGRPTLWTICGEAQAINVGNCMHMLAFGCVDRLRDRGVDGLTVAELVASLARTSITLTVGQKRDIQFEHEADVTPERYLEMIGGKTAALTRCATYGGALLALGTPSPTQDETLGAFAEYGWQLGLAFQIRDDVLGIWGAEADTGKASGGDIRRRKKSLPIVFAFTEAAAEDRARLRELYARPTELTAEEEGYVRHVLDSCHADTFADERAELHRRQAVEAVAVAGGGDARVAGNPFLLGLRELADFATGRAF